MHIETLKVFCDVVESGSFSAAALQNFITQSAVSQQLRALETKYGCKLLERTRAGAKPTREGEILYRAGREIIDRYHELETMLQQSANVIGGHLRVAIVYSVGLHEFPPYLKEYLRSYPEVNVHVEYSRTNQIYESVIAGVIDVGIVAYPQKHPQIEILPFREDQLVLACPPDHPLANSKRVSIARLRGQDMVGYERKMVTRKATDLMLRAHGITVRYTGEYDNIETLKRAVEIGQGAAIVPLPAILHEVGRGTIKLVRFSDPGLVRPLGIIHKRGRPLSPAAAKLVETLQREDIAP